MRSVVPQRAAGLTPREGPGICFFDRLIDLVCSAAGLGSWVAVAPFPSHSSSRS